MSGTTISSPAGFFLAEFATPTSVTDLNSALEAADTNIAAAATSAAEALASQNAAAASAGAAASSATTAQAAATSAIPAIAAASAAAASATSASNSATAASTSQTSAANSATSAATSSTAAGTSASNAATSATNSANSATAASGSATSASASATSAASAVTTAATSASSASTSASNASSSATNAASSASAASTSASTATTQAGNASTSATAAAGSASTASTQASAASASASTASTQATAASSSASSALTSANNAAASAASVNGENLLSNGGFNINIRQAAGGSITTSLARTMVVDRWAVQAQRTGGGTVNYGVVSLAAADATATGETSGLSFSGGSASTGTSDYILVTQALPNAVLLAGQNVTFSAWVRIPSGYKLGASIDQNTGTGGSPSAVITGTGQSVTGTGNWQKMTATFMLGTSILSATLGTNGDSAVRLNIWITAGSTLNTRSGSVGLQSVATSPNFTITGCKLERGTVATARADNFTADLDACHAVCSVFAVDEYAIVPSPSNWRFTVPSGSPQIVLVPVASIVSSGTITGSIVSTWASQGTSASIVMQSTASNVEWQGIVRVDQDIFQ